MIEKIIFVGRVMAMNPKDVEDIIVPPLVSLIAVFFAVCIGFCMVACVIDEVSRLCERSCVQEWWREIRKKIKIRGKKL